MTCGLAKRFPTDPGIGSAIEWSSLMLCIAPDHTTPTHWPMSFANRNNPHPPAGDHLPKFFRSAAISVFAVAVLSSCREVPVAKIPPQGSAIPVRVDAAAGMTRGGMPYFVKGAGGSGNLEQLASRGANSLRTWDTKGLADILDQAESLGLTVSAGIWLEHESSWFSYGNPEDCDKQAERVRKEILKHRDHPALLAWGIGNEVEGDGTNTAFWKQLDRLARLVKELDPSHPTFTAVAGANQEKVDGLVNHVPHLDFLGINTYGALPGLRKNLEKLGWKRPWMLTEWGPRGFWESPASTFGAPVEQTSSEKASLMGKAYQSVISNDGGCLGSYVFVWAWKFEATATWFGIYTHEGETTAVADALQEMWGGGKPANHAPAIERMRGVPKSSVKAGDRFEVSAPAKDPDGDALVWHWSVLPERKSLIAHAPEKMPKAITASIDRIAGDGVTVKAPDKPGIYRLYAWVKDGKGHAATANAPFEVR